MPLSPLPAEMARASWVKSGVHHTWQERCEGILSDTAAAPVCQQGKQRIIWSVIVWKIHRISLFNLPIALRSIIQSQLFGALIWIDRFLSISNKLSVFDPTIFRWTKNDQKTTKEWHSKSGLNPPTVFQGNDWNLCCISIAICSLWVQEKNWDDFMFYHKKGYKTKLLGAAKNLNWYFE